MALVIGAVLIIWMNKGGLDVITWSLIGFLILWLLSYHMLFFMHNLLVNCEKKLQRDMGKNLNGLPTCNCGKMRECTCSVIEKFIERDSNSKLIQFLMKLSDGGNSSKRDGKNVRNNYKHDVKRNCTHCKQDGHTMDQCFEKIGYPDWYKGKKTKKSSKLAAHVSYGFDEHFHGDTPFDMGTENEVAYGQNGRVD
uniref:Uncharacterized protein n=1 Tax=Tanacetum cinerariifolium TaxID=118510 RepID=A0A6L2K228_TANCI|nr:hypothetical protein [Tanacetum cinerariifolium]